MSIRRLKSSSVLNQRIDHIRHRANIFSHRIQHFSPDISRIAKTYVFIQKERKRENKRTNERKTGVFTRTQFSKLACRPLDGDRTEFTTEPRDSREERTPRSVSLPFLSLSSFSLPRRNSYAARHIVYLAAVRNIVYVANEFHAPPSTPLQWSTRSRRAVKYAQD